MWHKIIFDLRISYIPSINLLQGQPLLWLLSFWCYQPLQSVDLATPCSASKLSFYVHQDSAVPNVFRFSQFLIGFSKSLTGFLRHLIFVVFFFFCSFRTQFLHKKCYNAGKNLQLTICFFFFLLPCGCLGILNAGNVLDSLLSW